MIHNLIQKILKMVTLTFEVENPILFFKGFSIWEFKKNDSFKKNTLRILKENTFTAIELPSNYYKKLFMEGDWLKLDFAIPMEEPWGYECKKQFEIYVREPHYAFFLTQFREGLYSDIKGNKLTKEDHFMLTAYFSKGYYEGYNDIQNFKTDRSIQTNQQLVHEILDIKFKTLNLDIHTFNFDFIIDRGHFYRKGKFLGYNFALNEMIHKIPFSEIPRIIDEIELKTKWKLYLNNFYLHKNNSLSLQSHTESALNSKQNIFNKMPLLEVYNFFLKNLDETIITKDNLYIFFLKSFVGYYYPKSFFFYKNGRDGSKKEIYAIFYKFYRVSTKDQKFEKELKCKEKYIKLLCDNFEAFEYDVVKNNFRN